MYFEDFSSYRYELPQPVERVKNIGWLDGDHEFRLGPCDIRVTKLLEENYEQLAVHRMRGLHWCELCHNHEEHFMVRESRRPMILGSAELWVPGPPGTIFAAPDLILHYITKHSYHPPDQFVAAVLSLPGSLETVSPKAVLEEIERERE
jgi:hypothetical protein